VDSRRIQNEPADGGLDRLSAPRVERDAGANTAGVEEFTALLKVAEGGVSAFAARTSPGEDLADFIMPRLTKPAILQGGRSLAILEHLVTSVIPTLAESQQLRSLATAAIAAEIARRRDLLDRLHQGIAT
jgi:hypothetical protein